jgi:hypothetical protein
MAEPNWANYPPKRPAEWNMFPKGNLNNGVWVTGGLTLMHPGWRSWPQDALPSSYAEAAELHAGELAALKREYGKFGITNYPIPPFPSVQRAPAMTPWTAAQRYGNNARAMGWPLVSHNGMMVKSVNVYRHMMHPKAIDIHGKSLREWKGPSLDDFLPPTLTEPGVGSGGNPSLAGAGNPGGVNVNQQGGFPRENQPNIRPKPTGGFIRPSQAMILSNRKKRENMTAKELYELNSNQKGPSGLTTEEATEKHRIGGLEKLLEFPPPSL